MKQLWSSAEFPSLGQFPQFALALLCLAAVAAGCSEGAHEPPKTSDSAGSISGGAAAEGSVDANGGAGGETLANEGGSSTTFGGGDAGPDGGADNVPPSTGGAATQGEPVIVCSRIVDKDLDGSPNEVPTLIYANYDGENVVAVRRGGGVYGPDYVYDAQGRITERVDHFSGQTTTIKYHYEGERVVSSDNRIERGSGSIIDTEWKYSYDARGRITMYEVFDAQGIKSTTMTYGYSDSTAIRPSSGKFTSTSSGNTYQYGYNAANQLTHFSSNVANIWSTYGADGRIAESDNGSGRTTYTYEGDDRRVVETDGDYDDVIDERTFEVGAGCLDGARGEHWFEDPTPRVEYD
jgi:YD repeat-containing protein